MKFHQPSISKLAVAAALIASIAVPAAADNNITPDRAIRSSHTSPESECDRRETRAEYEAEQGVRICNARARRNPDYNLEDCLATRNGRIARRLERAGCDAEAFIRTSSAPVSSELAVATTCGETVLPNCVRRTESYVFGSINDKLTAHPELADELRLFEVDSCDEARDFIEAYNQFRQEHPERFLEEPSEPESGALEAKDAAGGDVGRPQIYLGDETDPWGDFWNGIHTSSVQIDSNCSGTFVSSRHILTAAHCYASSGRRNVTVRQRTSSGVYYDATYSAFVYVYPNWTGDQDFDDDIALISIDDPKFYGGTATRIYWGPINKGEYMTIAGWGAYDDRGGNPGAKQRTGGALKVSSVETYKFHAIAGEFRHCKGDSGAGTLGRLYDAGELVVVTKGLSNGAWISAGSCPEEGNDMIYTRITKVKADWIQKIMRNRFGSSFSCRYPVSYVYRCGN